MLRDNDWEIRRAYKRCRICGRKCYAKLDHGIVTRVVVCEHIRVSIWKLFDSPYGIELVYKKKCRKRNRHLGHIYKEPNDLIERYYEENNDGR